MIQGFNQGGQRAVGIIRMQLTMEDMVSSALFHVIDAKTSYNMLLDCPWLHENAIVPSTCHQCFIYCRNGIVKKVLGDNKPFTEAESHFADAKYYIEDAKKGKKYFPPKSQSHAIIKAQERMISTLEVQLSKAGYDPKEKLSLGKLPPEATRKKLHGLNATQNNAKGEEWTCKFKIEVLKAKAQTVILTQVQSDDEDDKESVASSNYINNGAEEDNAQTYHITLIEDGDVEEEDTEDAPAELEEGIKATIDELKEVNLGDIENPRSIDIVLTNSGRRNLYYITHEFKDVFAWSYKEIPGLDPKVVVHHLLVKKGAGPVKQGQRRFRPELISLIEGEVNKLIEVGFIREVKYPMWISSIIPIRKKNGQNSYMDFRDLNNACPKDDFLLPIAELMTDATIGHEALTFMDGSSGQQPYNVGATHQRAMQKIFDGMLHKNIECYVDDLVVKSKKREDHFYDLRKVFEHLRRYQLKMDPSKCAFGVTSGKFLGFIVRQRGIEIEQANVDAILRMPEPRNIHELKSLQGKLAYLQRFISNLVGRYQPFSHLMKKDVPFLVE
ncbi:UNVERIFIED_CONTAM: hypothetical protein Sradi_6502800 [Sesamum radiatum]|uniref:Reverse transcriptase domain-containing protein n=1 Tax=Sesamum radiatum TaxID=300843 RepID=A0AAW2JUX1_SESRA